MAKNITEILEEFDKEFYKAVEDKEYVDQIEKRLEKLIRTEIEELINGFPGDNDDSYFYDKWKEEAKK